MHTSRNLAVVGSQGWEGLKLGRCCYEVLATVVGLLWEVFSKSGEKSSRDCSRLEYGVLRLLRRVFRKKHLLRSVCFQYSPATMGVFIHRKDKKLVF